MKVQQKPLEPVTLKFYQSGNYLSDQDFKDLLADPVKKKYPHITVENVITKNDLPQLVAAGEPADFFITWNGGLSFYKDLNAFVDLTPLAKQSNFDLNRFDEGALNAIKAVSDKGELYALPYAINLNALYYNKDIFDKFGVPYPKDGMTWENAIELAKLVSRTDGGTKYRGLEIDSWQRIAFPLSLVPVDAKTNKATVNNDQFKRAFETAKQIFSVPGNEYVNSGTAAWNRFVKDKNVAMAPTVNLFLRFKESPDLNWDVAQFPSFSDKPNMYGMYDLHVMIPLKSSKSRDDQMRVMEVLFSDEVQSVMARKTARVSTMKDPKYTKDFGADVPELKGKNLAGIFKSKPAPAPEFSIHYSKAAGLVTPEYEKYIKNGQDINTALRVAEEKINQYIASQK
ncbi:ABC transporter substrate-binding protein [Paenibacillus allorhizosphaerae]|uniref:ABC transporter substrate-binding protein n=1 Tax=Paenibacillus allorhizosphaerae TaxID=2849866 RepID=UPI001C402D88|nr:extracellular solute-binding protein [Paenibacillus allorhizosphaerae]